jgi:hypothetical protein
MTEIPSDRPSGSNAVSARRRRGLHHGRTGIVHVDADQATDASAAADIMENKDPSLTPLASKHLARDLILNRVRTCA